MLLPWCMFRAFNRVKGQIEDSYHIEQISMEVISHGGKHLHGPATSTEVRSHRDFSSVRNYLRGDKISVIFPLWETISAEVLSHGDFCSMRIYLCGGPVSREIFSHRGKHFCKIVTSMEFILYIPTFPKLFCQFIDWA